MGLKELPDDERERMIAKQQRSTLYSSIFVIALGVYSIMSSISGLHLPDATQAIGVALFGLVIMSLIVQAVRTTRYNLRIVDEREVLQNYQAKERAYNFLNTGLLFIVLFWGSDSGRTGTLIGAIAILLGISWMILVKFQGRADV